jgi:hypothetical protein
VTGSTRNGVDELLLLRGRCLELIQALYRTRDCNPETLAALRRIIPAAQLPEMSETKSAQAPPPGAGIAA